MTLRVNTALVQVGREGSARRGAGQQPRLSSTRVWLSRFKTSIKILVLAATGGQPQRPLQATVSLSRGAQLGSYEKLGRTAASGL